MSLEKIQYTPGLVPPHPNYKRTWCQQNRKLVIVSSVILVITVAVISAAVAAQRFSMAGLAKSLTGNNEEPPYKIIRALPDGIEERVYPAQKWAITEEFGDPHSLDDFRTGMFWALFGYITGNNRREQKIEMTVPVSTKIEPDTNNTFRYQMGFYVPKEFQADPPEPTDPKVKIINRDLHVYTISFGGYAKEPDFDAHMKKLVDYLNQNNIPIAKARGSDEPIYYCVGYDSPHKFWNRKNEVWVLVQ